MNVLSFISVLRNCTVNFILNSNDAHLATASIFFYGSGSSINFCDCHFDKDKLLSLTVNDVYCKGPGLLDIYVS